MAYWMAENMAAKTVVPKASIQVAYLVACQAVWKESGMVFCWADKMAVTLGDVMAERMVVELGYD